MVGLCGSVISVEMFIAALLGRMLLGTFTRRFIGRPILGIAYCSQMARLAAKASHPISRNGSGITTKLCGVEPQAERPHQRRVRGQTVEMRRVWAMPNLDTFSVPPIGDLVRKYLHGVSVDPFARNKRWATYSNDLNPNTDAEYHMDAAAFLAMLHTQNVKADCIILDPPYSPRQISECYQAAGLKAGMKDTQNAALYARVRQAARRLCKLETVVLSFGWNSAGMGNGFEQIELLLVAHGGAHNDTICVVERMVQPELDLPSNLNWLTNLVDKIR